MVDKKQWFKEFYQIKDGCQWDGFYASKRRAKVILEEVSEPKYKMYEAVVIAIEPLEEFGINVYGITPNKYTREEEITAYLNSHPEVENFCILDDEFEFLKYKDNFVKTEFNGNGIEDIHVNKAIKILNKKKTFD